MKRKGPRRDVEKQRFWQRVVGGQRWSGQSIRDYCRSKALSEPSFYAWRRELARRRQLSGTVSRARGAAGSRARASRGAASSSLPERRRGGSVSAGSRVVPRFLPVRVVQGANERPVAAETGRGVEIVLEPGRLVRVQAGFDRQTLAEVLAVLEARPC